MHTVCSGFRFKLSSPAMVYEAGLIQNATLLAKLVDNLEIVLFCTATQHNIPGRRELRLLNQIAAKAQITYTVHLPSSLEIASQDPATRSRSVETIMAICRHMAELKPLHYVLHIPYSKPTLVPVEGLYFTSKDPQIGSGWTRRAAASLARIQDLFAEPCKLLVENINYAPSFLEPFFDQNLCRFCLDVGHLLLGREDVMLILENYLPMTREIHLHGIRNYADHFSVADLPGQMLSECLGYLKMMRFGGIMNLEVFSPRDLQTSMDTLQRALQAAGEAKLEPAVVPGKRAC